MTLNNIRWQPTPTNCGVLGFVKNKNYPNHKFFGIVEGGHEFCVFYNNGDSIRR
jgi:hypothetical protein